MFRKRRGAELAIVLVASGVVIGAVVETGSGSGDKFVWLEDVSSERSMAWVKAENERSEKILKGDPLYPSLASAALQVDQSPERLPTPDLNGRTVYNVWQDAQHAQGILRRTSLEDYLSTAPHWETVLDYDALSRRDGKKWVQEGRRCLYPGDELCLIALSEGGEDAVTLREFNLKSRKFVENGFTLPRSKQLVAWVDKDTLLVARDWGPGSMTRSGYPFQARLWKRGQRIEQAKEVYRGLETDEAVETLTFHDGDAHQATLLLRDVNFFETQVYLLTPHGVSQVALPSKVEVEGMVKGRLICRVEQNWTPPGGVAQIAEGSVIALDADALNRDPKHAPPPTVVFRPTAVEFVNGVEVTKNHLILTTLDNVQSRAYSYGIETNGGWRRERLSVPENQTVKIETANWSNDQFFVSISGFLTPSSLWLGDAAGADLKPAKTLPAQFDASRDVVEQLQAVSKDGTKVPYFVVRPKELKYNGENPTLLTAYGGFQLPSTPSYMAPMGKLWLERGGVFVLANIRGGGEFGPAWHEAGLKTHRQRIYDDFAAVGQDLVKRRITCPRRLGIFGGSNGGLLMGVEMTQHPEMWHAVGILVPLLDMLRYEQIAAGASWAAEYGSVSVPDERKFLASISPYHQLAANVNYPEPYIFTTTRDDRVGPVHARKFAARMEELRKPFLYEEITEGGHGSGADLKEKAQSEAMLFTYFNRRLM